MVQEAIQDGGGDGRVVVEDAWPVLLGLIGGNDRRPLLVAAADDLEEQISAGFVDGKISQFVQDRYGWSQEAFELSFEAVLGLSRGQGKGLNTRDVLKTPSFLKENEVERLYKACKSTEERFIIAVLFDTGARAEEFFSRKVLGRSIHCHLLRHSSATYYASKMNRQQLCIRYGWTFSSHMPDVYIARAGVDCEELDEKFKATEVETLRAALARKDQTDKLKEDRIRELESAVHTMNENFQALTRLMALNPSMADLEAALRRKHKGSEKPPAKS